MSQRVEPLLAAMAAGIVIANVAVAQGDALKAAIQIGRAAAARRVLRRGRNVAAARHARGRRRGGDRPRRRARRADLDWRAHRPARLRASRIRAGEYVWTGLISQAGITLGSRGGGRGGVSDMGHAGADAARGADRHRRARRPGAVPHRPGAGRRNRCARAAAAARRLEPRAVSAQLRRSRAASRARPRPAASPWRSMR